MAYLASVEVDQRQSFIQQADTLREMIGASRMIEASLTLARESARDSGVELFWPVSGVLRFYANELSRLAAYLASYKRRLEEISLTASIGLTEYTGDLDRDLERLDQKVRLRKDSKSAAVAVPSTPYFAPCRMLPQYPANHWVPRGADRGLRSWQAAMREDYRNRHRNEPVFGMRIPYGDLPELEELAPDGSDSYLGILKGDVDGLGKCLAALKFAELARHDALRGQLPARMPPAAGAAYLFCDTLTRAVQRSVHDAYEKVYPNRPRGTPWPFRHLIVAGDDLLILAQKQHALDLAYWIADQFGIIARADPVLRAAGASGLTISFGVLFAKAKFPFDASFDLADDLLHSAKQKEGPGPVGGGVDTLWLGDSARPRLNELRREHGFYRDAGKPLWLTRRPWGMDELSQHMAAARRVAAAVARRKVKQLEEIARMGKELAELGFLAWWKRLDAREQSEVKLALGEIGWADAAGNAPPQFWRAVHKELEDGFETCFLDLVEMAEVLES